MDIIRFEKKLNNTELGKGMTHDTYVLVPTDVDVTDIFETPGAEVPFVDINSGDTVILRNTVAREKRIVGLGEYYRSKNLFAGDEVIFEKRITAESEAFFINVKKYDEVVVVQKYKSGFEILTPERWNLLELWHNALNDAFSVVLKERKKKRTDSPEETNFYDICINGSSILDMYKTKEMLVLSWDDDVVGVHNFCNWKKTSFSVEV